MPENPVEGNSTSWSKGMDTQERQVPEKKQLEQCVVVCVTIHKQYRNGKKNPEQVVFCNPLCLNGKIKVFTPT